MIYHAIGLMSGSSLDGLDIAAVRLSETDGKWSYEWLATDCVPYSSEWMERLRTAKSLSVPEFLKLHTAYGHYTGRAVNAFIGKHPKDIPLDFIASHGHTIFHDPANGTTCQIGDGASIAAETGLPVISDLRNMDVALGGQGAPIVPLGEQLLFPDYDYWLNLGGIANITYQRGGLWTAFDICACNQVLNALAAELGWEYDRDGALAAGGGIDTQLLESLNGISYFEAPIPKSLDNAFSETQILPLMAGVSCPVEDRLRTAVEHIVEQVSAVVASHSRPTRMLVTGGGALNTFLVQRMREKLRQKSVELIVPDYQTVQYKEALIMALLGARRWRGETTVIHSVTGARKSSIGGALWQGWS